MSEETKVIAAEATEPAAKTESAIVAGIKKFGVNIWGRIRYAGLYLRYRIKLIHFSKYHTKLWLARFALNISYMLQGFIALLTLNFIEPNLSRKPSQWVALRRSDAHDYQELVNEKKDLEKQKEEGEEVDELKLAELVQKQESFNDIDSEMDDWAKKFSKKKNYDERGHLIKDK